MRSLGRVWTVGFVALLSIASPGPPLALSGGGSLAASTSAFAIPELFVNAAVHPFGYSCSTTSLCPATVRSAYNFTGLLSNSSTNGTGESVVIVDSCGDPKIASDLKRFDTAMGLAAASLTVYYPQGTPCSRSVWLTETALDVEWAHVTAPGAAIHLVIAHNATNAALFDAWNYSLAHHLGNQFSNSWGGNGHCGPNAKGIIGAAARAGVTVLASTGDSGAWGSGTTGPAQLPADCKETLAVGGTTLTVSASGVYKSERGWGGSGGGYAPSTSEPAYESAVTIANTYSELATPDVAAVADPSTGVWVYAQALGGWFTVGGTSVACPLWAGFVADANDWRASNSYPSLGAFDPYLYLHVYGPNGASANYSREIHDVTTGSNGWSAGIGWDAVTGIGSFDAYPLAQQLGTDRSA